MSKQQDFEAVPYKRLIQMIAKNSWLTWCLAHQGNETLVSFIDQKLLHHFGSLTWFHNVHTTTECSKCYQIFESLPVNLVDNDRVARAYAWCSEHPELQNSVPYQIHHRRAETKYETNKKIHRKFNGFHL